MTFREAVDQITTSNLLALISGIGLVLSAGVLLYFRIRTLIATEQARYLRKVQELLNEQTKVIHQDVNPTGPLPIKNDLSQ